MAISALGELMNPNCAASKAGLKAARLPRLKLELDRDDPESTTLERRASFRGGGFTSWKNENDRRKIDGGLLLMRPDGQLRSASRIDLR